MSYFPGADVDKTFPGLSPLAEGRDCLWRRKTPSTRAQSSGPLRLWDPSGKRVSDDAAMATA